MDAGLRVLLCEPVYDQEPPFGWQGLALVVWVCGSWGSLATLGAAVGEWAWVGRC